MTYNLTGYSAMIGEIETVEETEIDVARDPQDIEDNGHPGAKAR